MKLQETPEELNSGDIPKIVSVFVDRELTEILTAGSRVTITGLYQVNGQSGTVGNALKGKDLAVKSSFIKAIGINIESK